MGAAEACEIGLVDGAFGSDVEGFLRHLEAGAAVLAADPALPSMLEDKRRRRSEDERARPLASYRAHELARMADNFFGPDPSYHVARISFVRKLPTTEPTSVRNAQFRSELAA
jgi:putative two-component system hydrogenase maturation factor HypX/HoxX